MARVGPQRHRKKKKEYQPVPLTNTLYVYCKLGTKFLDKILIGLLLHKLKLLKILSINLKCFTR